MREVHDNVRQTIETIYKEQAALYEMRMRVNLSRAYHAMKDMPAWKTYEDRMAELCRKTMEDLVNTSKEGTEFGRMQGYVKAMRAALSGKDVPLAEADRIEREDIPLAEQQIQKLTQQVARSL